MNWSLLRWLLKSWWNLAKGGDARDDFFADVGGESLRFCLGSESDLAESVYRVSYRQGAQQPMVPNEGFKF